MNDLEKRTLDMFKAVRDLDAAHRDLFAAGSLGRELFDAVGEVVKELEACASAEAAGRGAARQGTVSKGAAKAAIIEDLGILRRTARSMSGVMPGIEEKFSVPHRQDGQELINTARSALAAAEPIKAEFLRREVPERVFRDLPANINAYEAAHTGQNTARKESLTAAASIDAAIERGMDAMRELDPLVRNRLLDNHPLLAAWLSARRIQRGPRRNNTNAPAAPETPGT